MTTTRGQLFDFDDVEQAIKTAVLAACSTTIAPVQVLKSSEGPTNNTPRVEILLITQPTQNQRFLLNQPFTDVRMQPLNTWLYELTLNVVCNREQNGSQLVSIRGNARAAMQWCYLWPFIGIDVLPLHGLVNIQEQPMNLGVENIGDLDMSKLSFYGLVSIRNQAWALLNPPIPSAEVTRFNAFKAGSEINQTGPSSYLVISNADERICMYAQTNLGSIQPDASGEGANEYYAVPVNVSETAAQIAGHYSDSMSLFELTPDLEGTDLTVTDTETGAREPASAAGGVCASVTILHAGT